MPSNLPLMLVRLLVLKQECRLEVAVISFKATWRGCVMW